MKISEKGLQFLTECEGVRLSVYKDVAGKLTIGVGHLLTISERRTGVLITGDKWIKGISTGVAKKLLQKDIEWTEKAVNELVSVPLSQNQFDTLASFTFNVGRRNLARSTLLKRLNNSDYAAVPNELMRWKKAERKVSRGLIHRRRKEGALWRSAEVKSPVKSRTNQGAAIAATGQVLGAITEATDIANGAKGLAAQFGEYAQWVCIAVTFLGIAYILYARWDDRRRGIR